MKKLPKAKLNPKALGYASAILAGACMLLLGILGNLGIYTDAVEMMAKWHIFFSLSPVGIIAGVIEGALSSFVLGYAFGWLYNKFV